MSVHNQDIRTCDIPAALQNAKSVPWDSEGRTGEFFNQILYFYSTT